MATQFPRVMEFDSRHPEAQDAKVHMVTFTTSKRAGVAGPAGTAYVNCTCTAGQFYWANLRRGNRVTGCWAMNTARKLFEIPTPPFIPKRAW